MIVVVGGSAGLAVRTRSDRALITRRVLCSEAFDDLCQDSRSISAKIAEALQL